MILYEAILENKHTTARRSKLILSNEPLAMENINIYAIVNAGTDENLITIKTPEIIINAWDANEANELDRIKNQLIYY